MQSGRLYYVLPPFSFKQQLLKAYLQYKSVMRGVAVIHLCQPRPLQCEGGKQLCMELKRYSKAFLSKNQPQIITYSMEVQDYNEIKHL